MNYHLINVFALDLHLTFISEEMISVFFFLRRRNKVRDQPTKKIFEINIVFFMNFILQNFVISTFFRHLKRIGIQVLRKGILQLYQNLTEM